MAAYCHRLSHKAWQAAQNTGPGVRSPEPFSCAPHSFSSVRGLEGLGCTPILVEPGPHVPLGGRQGLELPQALPQSSANLPRPASSRLPACPAVGRFQGLKIALEESQVWGSRREMSLRRAANSTPRHAGGGVSWAGNTPWRPAPAANGEPPVTVALCCPEGGQGLH